MGKFTKNAKFGFAIILLIMFLEGCATRPVEATYIEVPEGYLQACELPAVPQDNAELSDAFAQAYRCGEQGNTDKERIKNLPRL